jgi:DNA replication protein DnaC
MNILVTHQIYQKNKYQKNQKPMNRQITLDRLHELRLTGMERGYRSMAGLQPNEQPSADELVARLAEAEYLERAQKRMLMLTRQSKLRYDATLEQIHCNKERNFSREQQAALLDCSFILRAENILVTGATGTGKSWLICAIGRQACHLGYKTIYLPMNRFLEKMALARIQGTFLKLLDQLHKMQLIIFDDFGIQPLTDDARMALLQILEDRYGQKATIVASQLPVDKWHTYINQPTMADAICDRLTAKAFRIDLKGKSLR